MRHCMPRSKKSELQTTFTLAIYLRYVSFIRFLTPTSLSTVRWAISSPP